MSTLDCPACSGAWPAPEQRIADLGLAVAYLHDDQFFPGWTLLVLKRHATELFQLTREERGRLVEEVSAVAEALAATLRARKVNYELLGNQIAHIHWHVIPRLPDDPAPREPVWGLRHEPRRLTPDERRQRITALQARLRPPA